MDLSNPANLIIAVIYYAFTGVLALFSLFGIYVLMRYGKSTLLALVISLFFCLFFLTILANSYQSLQSL